MSVPAPEVEPPAREPRNDGRRLPAWLPSRTALLVAAVAFAAGLALFGALWLDQRNDDDFLRGDGVPRSSEGQAFEPLPAPLPAAGDGNLAGSGEADAEVAAEPEPAPGPAPVQPPPPPVAPPAPAPSPAPAPLADDSLPRPVDAPAPRYPPSAQRRGHQGTVVLRVHVDARGVPVEIDIVDGSGSRVLDRAALDAVRRWRFAPAMRDGRPVAGSVQVPIDFTLQR